MTYTEKKFKNGLRLITAPSEGTKAITLLILVGAGSRYENEKERGTAHFLEHMFFKGAEKYTNAREVSEKIDGVGGDFNAFTGKEYAGYYVKVASEKKEVAFDVLSDMLLKAKFDISEINKERGVIMEELNMYEDMPVYKIGWDFEQLLFDNHPMALDQIGTPELINSIETKDFQKFQQDLYTPENTVIVVSGNITPEESEKLTEEYFQFANTRRSREAKKFEWNENRERIHIREKNTEQAHLVIGYPGLDHFAEDKYAESILAILLGGNMSSRMFLNVREAKGLCYSISSTTDRYSDCGIFSTRAGVDISRVEEAITSIIAEYEKIRETAPSEDEVQRAKNFLTGKVTLRMEDSEEIASFFGTQTLLQDKTETLDHYFEKINAVTADEVFAVAKKLFDPAKRSMAMIGPFGDKKEIFQKLLNT